MPPLSGRWRGARPGSPACRRGRHPEDLPAPPGDGPSSVDGGVGLPGRVLASGEPAWVADIREDPAFAGPDGGAAAGIRAAAAFPITGTRGVRGVIELFSRRPRRPDPSLMEAMTSVGRYIGQHMERRRAEEAVRRGEAVRGAVLESAIDSVITMNHEGRVVEFNPAAERTFGYRRSDAVGKLVRELIVPAAPARGPSAWARALPRNRRGPAGRETHRGHGDEGRRHASSRSRSRSRASVTTTRRCSPPTCGT